MTGRMSVHKLREMGYAESHTCVVPLKVSVRKKEYRNWPAS